MTAYPLYYFEDPGDAPVMYFAGPTRFDDPQDQWHYQGVQYLESVGYQGYVALPMPRDGNWSRGGYDAQLDWQLDIQRRSGAVVVWLPRSGFATGVEVGDLYRSGKLVVGSPYLETIMAAPENTLPGIHEQIKLLVSYARRGNAPVTHDLRDALDVALRFMGY